ncbi:hypothetical protein ACFWYW_12275 [Nonomuraea sp. NPDC059023]|uniref:hypothetical protein n=1 Tax=unclassified Nonomuraea TaxID=2593643 RepID=UPI00367927D0
MRHADAWNNQRVTDQIETVAQVHAEKSVCMSRVEFLDYFDLDISTARTLYGMYLRACAYARLSQREVIDSAVSTR